MDHGRRVVVVVTGHLVVVVVGREVVDVHRVVDCVGHGGRVVVGAVPPEPGKVYGGSMVVVYSGSYWISST